jgi:acetate kinase
LAALMRVLVVNAGSSSLKLRLVGCDDSLLWHADLPADAGRSGVKDLERQVKPLREKVDAVGHRVVHGGPRFRSPVLLDDEVERAIRDLGDLAPLHQAKSLAGIEALGSVLPGLPAVACFDTAFHSTLPAAAFTYAVPVEWRRLGVRRFGFHGLSHAYAARRAREMLERQSALPPGPLRAVTCHLGAGASLAAVSEGRSVDTTMGFTPLEGLVMATRSGSVDPGMAEWLLAHTDADAVGVTRALEESSGLLALAGSADMEAVLEAVTRGEGGATLALDVYLHRLRGAIASMAASLGGMDVLVFTGGVGENAAAVRSGAAGGLSFLGVGIDNDRNARARPDTDVTAEGAAVRALVVEAREDLQIASEVRGVLGGGDQLSGSS